MLPKKKYTAADYTAIARRRLPLVIVPGLVGLLVALIVSSRLPNVYEAEMLVQIVPQRVPESFVETTVTIQTEDRLDALSQQVTSRTQLERIVRDIDLYGPERAVQPMQDVIEKMRTDITVVPQRQARTMPVEAFTLKFKYGDPAVAARVTERLGSLFIDQNARERGDLAGTTRDFLQTRLLEAKGRLEVQDKKLQEFRERNAGKLPTQAEYNMQAIQSTQMQRQAVVESLARDRDRKLMLDRMRNDLMSEPTPSRPLPAPLTPADPAGLANVPARQRLEIARATLARLELRLTESHPDLRRAREQVAEIEKEVQAEPPTQQGASTAAGMTPEELQRRERINSMGAEIESLDRQIAFKEAEERRLSGSIADYQRRIEAVPGVESEWLSLTRDYETISTAFRELLTKSESANAAVELENRQVSEQFRVLDAPRVPLRPIESSTAAHQPRRLRHWPRPRSRARAAPGATRRKSQK